MAHKSKSPESRTRRIERLVGEHRQLKSALGRALSDFQNSNSLVWPFNKVYRPWEGELPTPNQAAAIEWRRTLGALVEGVRTLFAPWDDRALRELFPLVEWESGNLANRSSDWVLAAIDRQIESLRTELSDAAVEEQQWTEEVAADSAHRPSRSLTA